MKNVSVILNVVLGFAVLFLIFKNNPKQKNDVPPVTAEKDVIENCKNVCMDYSADPDLTILDGDIVRRMASDYKNTANLTPGDAHSVWFELDALKKFIWNIDKAICEQNCNATNLKLGVRIYYGRYPQTGAGAPVPFDDLPSEYSGKHTVFMVPTYEVRNNFNQDFYLNKPFASCVPIAIPSDGSIDPVGLFIPIGKNHGALCPPVCNGTAFEN